MYASTSRKVASTAAAPGAGVTTLAGGVPGVLVTAAAAGFLLTPDIVFAPALCPGGDTRARGILAFPCVASALAVAKQRALLN